MSFFKVKRDAASVKESTGGNYINRSDIYDVTILAPFVDVNQHGAATVNFFVDYNGQPQAIYGQLRLHNNDGSENPISAPIFNKLCIVTEVDPSDPVEGTLPIGKAGAEKDVAVLEDFIDCEVKMRVQMEYSVYEGSITEKKVIKGFYRADGAVADEIVNESEVGVQLEKDQAYKDNISYRDSKKNANDAPTPEQVKAWVADGRPKGTAGTGASAATEPKKTPSFGQKKAFGSK